MLPLHLSGNKQLRQTKLSSFFLSLCLPVCQTPTLAVLWLQHPAQSYSYLKQAMDSTLACASPFRAAYVLCVLLPPLISAACLLTTSACTLAHSPFGL